MDLLLSSRINMILLELAPLRTVCSVVAGYHRASPSTSLDKRINQYVILKTCQVIRNELNL
jgi:hypothetical protein